MAGRDWRNAAYLTLAVNPHLTLIAGWETIHVGANGSINYGITMKHIVPPERGYLEVFQINAYSFRRGREGILRQVDNIDAAKYDSLLAELEALPVIQDAAA